MFDELYINDYCNFNTFRMIFPEKKTKDCANLNLIVGKNGSGKSSLLDALFEIGEYNLKDNFAQIDNTRFEYKILKENKVISSNLKIKSSEEMSKEDKNSYLWDAVIRLHTGHTARQCNACEANVYSIQTNTTKWALLAYIASGVWNHMNTQDWELWNKLQDIVFGEKNHIEPQIIWLDIKKDYNFDEIYKFIIRDIREPDSSMYIGNNITRFFWNLKNPIFIEPPGTNIKQEKINPLPLLAIFLSKIDPVKQSNDMNGRYIDTGFLYTQGESDKLYPDSFLSDGEHGFFTRFALLMLLKEENLNYDKHYLILLDEPETHFNENWKTSFLNLLCKVFENAKHDIFIATHSAMLVTDAKEDEIHRLENLSSGIIHYPVPIKTYGANIIDIGRALFKMESDIGERVKNDIQRAMENNDEENLENLLKQVGPGEWRWKIRTKLNQIEQRKNCYYLKEKNNGENS